LEDAGLMRSPLFAFAFVATALWVVTPATQTGSSAIWPQWRGPARDGRASVSLPAKWATQPTEIWKREVGIGHASPIIGNDRVYAFARRGEEEVLSAHELQSGKELWAQGYPAPYTMNPAAARHGMGPKSTAVLHEGRIYTLGISGVLSSFDAATGAVKWRLRFDKEFPKLPAFGTAMSPLVEGGMLIAHVGGDNAGALRAFDLATGKVRWSWNQDGPGYASPILVSADGVRQIVTQSQQLIVGVEAGSGKELWRVPFTTEYDQNVVTPLAYKDTIVLSGIAKGTFAMRVSRDAGGWKATKVWENPDVSMYMSSPVVHGETIFGLSHRNRGQFFAVDAATGKTLWTSPPRQGENAAIVVAGDTLFLLTDTAELVVARATPKQFDPVARFEVAPTPTWAHPVVLGGRMLVKDERTLAMLQLAP
jgi:outer membrane protein assembly factor BamB